MQKFNARKSIGTVYEREHFVELYGNEKQFLTNLKNFIGAGLRHDAPCIVIATEEHLATLEKLLKKEGIDTAAAAKAGHYVTADAAETLARFMRNGMPDKDAFKEVASSMLNNTQAGQKPVRVFGEMVALLWEQGQLEATVAVEAMWNEMAKKHHFTLFCAYPAHHFTERVDIADCHNIARLHSSVIAQGLPAFG